jgi:hypothetical protein
MRSNDDESSPIRVGDRIVWWCDPGGRGAGPGDVGARQHTGTVIDVWHSPTAPDRVVAYRAASTTALGEHVSTVRPEHQPRRTDPPR